MRKNLSAAVAISLAGILCAFVALGLVSCDTPSASVVDVADNTSSSPENDGNDSTDKRLPPPELNSVWIGGTSIVLDWVAVDGADEYCVYFAQGEMLPSEGFDVRCRTSTGCLLVLDSLPGPGTYTGYIVAFKNKVAGYQGFTWRITVPETTYPPFEETCSYSNGYVGSGYELGVGYDQLTDSTGTNLFSSFETDSYNLTDTGAWMDYSLFRADLVSGSLIMLQQALPFSTRGGVIEKSFFPDAKAAAFLKNLTFFEGSITAVAYMRIQYEYRVPMLLYGTFVENIAELPYPSYVRETKKGLEIFFLYQLQTGSRYAQDETKTSLERLIQNTYRASETYTDEDRAKDLEIVRADGNRAISFAYSNLSLPGVENIRTFGDYQDYVDAYFSLDASSRMESLGLVEATFFPLSYNPGPHSGM